MIDRPIDSQENTTGQLKSFVSIGRSDQVTVTEKQKNLNP
jgi:hypothetical protein